MCSAIAARQPIPTRQEIISAIQSMAVKLGRMPNRSEFYAHSGIQEYPLRCVFPAWGKALQAAGFTPPGKMSTCTADELFEDWGRVVRELKRRPLKCEYNKVAKFSWYFLKTRAAKWKAMPCAFRTFAQDKPEWIDVLEILDAEVAKKAADKQDSPHPPCDALSTPEQTHAAPILLEPRMEILRLRNELMKGLKERPRAEYASLAYGDPIDFRRLRNAPVNENGVILLFGMLAAKLGLLIEAVQPGFPDCEAKYRADDGKWRRLRIEFEYESRNFLVHGHNADDCDVIVCWRHNWKECPLHVIELSTAVKELKAA